MSVLALWVGSLFGSLMAWLGKLFTQRLVIGVAAIAPIPKSTSGLIWFGLW